MMTQFECVKRGETGVQGIGEGVIEVKGGMGDRNETERRGRTLVGTVGDFRDRCCGERDSEERPGENCIFRLSLRGLSLEFRPLHAFPVRPSLCHHFFPSALMRGSLLCPLLAVFALYSRDATSISKLQAMARQLKIVPIIMTENVQPGATWQSHQQ